ncbi:MAG: hypothetical protein QF895_03955 [SAR86 cluster bacterium]|nr:hypothetical protein [SAR86 cluster bacterium]
MIIGLYLDDFSLLNKITNKLKSKEFNLKHVKKVPENNDEISVIISKEKLKNCVIPQVQPDNLDILELRLRCTLYDCHEVVAGIDPGGTNGLAIVGNNRVLYKNEFEDIGRLSIIIKSINDEIGLQTIKIGSGSPPERNQIINSLNDYSGLIKLVSEERSGSRSHAAAATRIALRKELSENPMIYKPKNGEIAWVQQESRRLSKGLVTIDKHLAHQILVGEITMDEAIHTYTNRMKTH